MSSTHLAKAPAPLIADKATTAATATPSSRLGTDDIIYHLRTAISAMDETIDREEIKRIKDVIVYLNLKGMRDRADHWARHLKGEGQHRV
jgi:hypothetical protein